MANKDQKVLIKHLSKDLKIDRSEVEEFLIDMGITLLISSRKSSDEGGLDKMIPEIEKRIKENSSLSRMAQVLEHSWNQG